VNKAVFLFFTLIIFQSVHCQTKTDSLKQALAHSRSDTAKFSVLNKLSDAYYENDPDKALEFALKSARFLQKKAIR
jgi:hypothetical protein